MRLKPSNQILIAIGAVFFATVLALLIVTRFMVGAYSGFREEPADASVEEIERTLSVANFNRIETGGVWRVHITQGTSQTVTLTVPEYLEPYLIAEVRGSLLKLGLKSGAEVRTRSTAPRADIIVGSLTQLQSSGAVDATIEGFSESRFAIQVSGGTNLLGINCTVQNLTIKVSGAAKIDLRESTAKNAEVKISGAGVVELTMDGGDLAGNISGAASLTYFGEVRSEQIEASGLSSVRRR